MNNPMLFNSNPQTFEDFLAMVQQQGVCPYSLGISAQAPQFTTHYSSSLPSSSMTLDNPAQMQLGIAQAPQSSVQRNSLLPSPADDAFMPGRPAITPENGFQPSPPLSSDLSQFWPVEDQYEHVSSDPFQELKLEAVLRDNRRPNGQLPKGARWTFSPSLQKIYVQRMTKLPIEFRVDRDVPLGTRLRMKVVYDEKRFPTDTIERCHHHQVNDDKEFLPGHSEEITKQHFLLSLNKNASYKKDSNDLSVTVPFNAEDKRSINEQLMFSCQCTCPSIKGRFYHLEFNLEHSKFQSDVVELGIKVCSSVKRDRRTDEEKQQSAAVKEEPSTPTPGAAKRRKKSSHRVPPSEDKRFPIDLGIVFVANNPRAISKAKEKAKRWQKVFQEDLDADESDVERDTTDETAASDAATVTDAVNSQ